MEIEEIICPLCKSPYDSEVKLPRLLFKCGHSICQDCIQTKLNMMKNFQNTDNNLNFYFSTENSQNLEKKEIFQKIEKNSQIFPNFTCPEDNICYSEFLSLDSFPKNLTLLKLITQTENKRKTIKNSNHEYKAIKINISLPEHESDKIIYNDNLLYLDNLTIIKEDIEHKDNSSPNLRKSHAVFQPQNAINSIRCSIKKQATHHEKEKEIHSNTPTNNANNILTSNFNIKFCSLHPNRPLEIICIDDKIKICTNCALFGDHKNHKILNEEDFMKEIEVKAEILIELFELIERNVNEFKSSRVNEKNPSSFSSRENNVNFSEIYQNLLKKSEEKKNDLTSQVKNFTEELMKNITKEQNIILSKINNRFEKINNKITAIKDLPDDLIVSSENWKELVQEKLDSLNLVFEAEGNLIQEEGYVKLIETNITDEKVIKHAETILQEFEKFKNFSVESFDRMIEDNQIDIDYDLANRINSVIKFSNDAPFPEDDLLFLDEEEKKHISKKSQEIINIGNNCITTGSHTNNNSIFTSLETEMSAVNHIGFTNFQNICELNTLTNSLHNNSFLNFSEDSALIVDHGPGKEANLNSSKDISVSNQSNQGIGITNSNLMSPRNFKSPVKNSNVNVKSNFSNVQNININMNNANPITTPITSSNVHTIKLPNGPRKDNKSRSPIKHTHSTNTPDKDKVVVIKNQFKNEIANFTGYGNKKFNNFQIQIFSRIYKS